MNSQSVMEQDLVKLCAVLSLLAVCISFVSDSGLIRRQQQPDLSSDSSDESPDFGRHLIETVVDRRHRRGTTPGPRPISPLLTQPGGPLSPEQRHPKPWLTVIQPDTPCRPADTLRQRRTGLDGRWFNFSNRLSVQFFAYTAFWDDRERHPMVRVIAASTSNTAGIMTKVPVPLEYGVRCRYHMPDGRWLEPVSAMRLALPIGYGWWLNDRLIREFIYDCPPPTRQDGLPDAVTMLVGAWPNSTTSQNVDDPARTACVPVEYPVKPAVKGEFAVCLQVPVTSIYRNIWGSESVRTRHQTVLQYTLYVNDFQTLNTAGS